MILKNIFLLVISLMLAGKPISAQTAENYPVEGVYSNFTEFRIAKPKLTRNQLHRSGTSSQELTIRQWVNTEKLLFLDDSGSPQSFNRRDFWGFYENGTLWVFLGGKFHKVNLLGKISYFLESYPTIKGNPSPVVTETRSSSIYRLLDMETGDLSDYNIQNLQELIADDEELSTEFKTIISQKVKRKRLYSFMERYNSKYPLKPIVK